MSRKRLYVLIVLPLLFIIAACSSLKIPGASPAAASNQDAQVPNGTPGRNFSLANQPVENKLAIGILKLEGTPNAVTAKQAADLLPLFKAVKSLSTSNNTSSAEIQAVYKQIEDTLTPDQVTAIKNLNMNQKEMQALFQQYGVQFNQGGGFANLTQEQRATRIAQFQQNGGGNAAGGAGAAGGNRGGGGFGGVPGGGGFVGGQGQGQPNVQRTPRPGGGRGGMNILLADPVIKLLQQKTSGSGS